LRRVALAVGAPPIEVDVPDRRLEGDCAPEGGAAIAIVGLDALCVFSREGVPLGWTPLVGPIVPVNVPGARSICPTVFQDRRTPENPAGAPPRALDEIRRCFPSEAADILRALRHHCSTLDEHWSFSRWGHFVGVEADGYIHS
jgi:hypothetical protein